MTNNGSGTWNNTINDNIGNDATNNENSIQIYHRVNKIWNHTVNVKLNEVMNLVKEFELLQLKRKFSQTKKDTKSRVLNKQKNVDGITVL